MKRPIVMTAILCLVFAWRSVAADDAQSAAAAKLQAEPNNVTAWRSYLTVNLAPLMTLIQSDPDAAEKKLGEMKAVIAGLNPETPEAKRAATSISASLDRYGDQIVVSPAPMDELATQLKAAPDDLTKISQFMLKITMQVGRIARSEPEQAGKLLGEAKTTFEAARGAATSEAAKKQYDAQARMFESYERTIEGAKKLLALIGQDSAPLSVDAWVNGDAVTDTDLKGKVVLLDFWAIWCGPCIATFPHLREWNEKYESKGLVMIGLTNYYNYQWDEAASRATKATAPIAHEAEHEMLKKFAAHHQLKHRFGVQADRGMSLHYGVTGIPHVVVIDQAGKIRMMKVGSGEENAKAIGELLEKLLGSPKVAGN